MAPGDSEFEWKSFIDANNNELLKNLGNFVNRILKFVNAKNFNSVIPHYDYQNIPSVDEWTKEINTLLKQYNTELEAVKIKGGLATALHISAVGNRLLQSHTLDNRLAVEQPDKCAAVVGYAVNLVHLLAGVIGPYLPATCESILTQLNMAKSTSASVPIPESWDPSVIPPGHTLGNAAHLFSQIKAEKEQEWREEFGGEELKRLKAEKAARAAKKKADKNRKKNIKGNAAEGSSVEATAKDGAQNLDRSEDAVEAVTKGVSQTALQSS